MSDMINQFLPAIVFQARHAKVFKFLLSFQKACYTWADAQLL